MKKLIVVLSMILFASAGFARKTVTEYVVTGNRKLECKRIDLGFDKARVVLTDGKKSILPVSSITSYDINGKRYDKVELYNNNRDQNNTAFMQLIKKRGDLSLYRYKQYDYDAAFPFQTYDTFYVYQNGKMYLQLDKKSLPNVFHFFDVHYVIG